MKFFAKIFIALLISLGFYYSIDYLAVKNWNNNESLIVRVIEAGPESVVKHENIDEDNDNYETLERSLVLQVLSGNHSNELITLKTIRLSGSSLEVVPGRRYLLVWDMFICCRSGDGCVCPADCFNRHSRVSCTLGTWSFYCSVNLHDDSPDYSRLVTGTAGNCFGHHNLNCNYIVCCQAFPLYACCLTGKSRRSVMRVCLRSLDGLYLAALRSCW